VLHATGGREACGDMNNLCVVLVRTRNPLNMGAVARAMQNFGVRDLRVVAPYEASFREARSATGAGAVMEEAREFATVADAVADCRLVVGTTAARRRDLQQQVVDLDAAAPLHAAMAECRVALLFGSEKHGLTREDLDHCHWLLRITTEAEQPSMNLGQAAAVCLWALTRPPQQGTAGNSVTGMDPAGRAPAGDLERLGALWMEVLNAAGYVPPRASASTAAEVRRLLRRLRVTDTDTHLLMGMARRLLWRLKAGPRA